MASFCQCFLGFGEVIALTKKGGIIISVACILRTCDVIALQNVDHVTIVNKLCRSSDFRRHETVLFPHLNKTVRKIEKFKKRTKKSLKVSTGCNLFVVFSHTYLNDSAKFLMNFLKGRCSNKIFFAQKLHRLQEQHD